MAFLNIFIFSKAQTRGYSRRNSGISRLPLFMQLKMDVSQVDQRVCNGNVSVGFLQYNKHLFVHIGHANHSYSDPLLESVDIRQIYDKFPEKKGGLKELFGKGPQNAFFLVKFWVSKTLLWFQWVLSERLHPTLEGRTLAVDSRWLICRIAKGSQTHIRGPSSCWPCGTSMWWPRWHLLSLPKRHRQLLGLQGSLMQWQETLQMAGVTMADVRHLDPLSVCSHTIKQSDL